MSFVYVVCEEVLLMPFSILNALEMQVHPCSSNFLITLGKCIHVVVIC